MVNIEQHKNLLKVSYVNKEGNIELMDIEVPEKEYFKWGYSTATGSKKYKSWDNKPIKKIKTNYLDKYRITEFLLTQSEEVQSKLFDLHTPKIYFVDIETEILDEFPNPENPKSQIYCISIVSQTNKVISLSTKPLLKGQEDQIKKELNEYFKDFEYDIKYEFILFNTEYDMLYTFFKKYVKRMPTITGWNFVGFDWPYLISRAKYLNVDPSMCSPTGKMMETRITNNLDKTTVTVMMPLHKMVVDYLQVYKKWDNIVSTKENDSLDYVSETVLGVHKLHYSSSLTDLYNNNYKDYILYNAIDSYLVKLIHEKLNSIAPYFALGAITKVEHHKVYSSIAMIENIMCIELLKHNKILVKNEDKEIDENKEYVGGFVFPVVPGFYENLITFDYASLYPTTIRQHNISPEIYLGKSETLDLKHKEENVIYCASGAKFDKTEHGVLPMILTKIYKERRAAKKIYGDIEAEIKYLKEKLKTK